jgi:hypothetical protein
LAKELIDLSRQVGNHIRRFRGDSQEWEAGGFKDSIHKFISLLSVASTMAFVIQFNGAHRPHCREVTEQEIDVLSIDSIPFTLRILSGADEDDIPKVYFAQNRRLRPNSLMQALVE